MQTYVLDSDSGDRSIGDLVRRAANGGVEVRDAQGHVLAYILSPADKEAWIYAEALLEIEQHKGEIEEAVSRAGGVTTTELLNKAKRAGLSTQIP